MSREKGETRALDDHAFLGREFLAWLAYFADDQGGVFDGFSLQLGGRCVLRAVSGLITDVTLKGSSPGTSPELRYALAGGLLPRQLDLRLQIAARKKKEEPHAFFFFSLGAELLDLTRVKLPALLAADEADAESEDDFSLAERLTLLHQLDECVRAAYAHFIALRAAPKWARSVVPAMRAWLDAGI